MGLFPQSFIGDLRMQADLVQVIEQYVPLKRAGSGYKGLCPFHGEKTPSFHVSRDRGLFHCFGCGVGGDVFKFLELQEKMAFPEAVRQLAQRFGVPVPEPEQGGERSAAAAAEREALLRMHELATHYFREQLAAPAGGRARNLLRTRGLAPSTIEALELGYAPPGRDGLTALLTRQGFPPPMLLRSGLLVERGPGRLGDRFRNRLMIPIRRESGSVVAFGGRASEDGQQPKYLNSPETPIYSKSRTLYGLHHAKATIRRLGYAVIVEGYFDFAQATQAGVTPVVASCGTALTGPQAHLLHRFTDKVVISFDPDVAGHGAAARSCDLLVGEGFQVNVAVLPEGEDPDTYIRRHGGAAYVERLRTSSPYLDYLMEQTASRLDLGRDEGRREFLNRMLAVAAKVPDAAVRDQFADRLAHKARIMEDVVRAEIRKAAAGRRTTLSVSELPQAGELRPAEVGLLWWLIREPADGFSALAELEPSDLAPLASGPILHAAQALLDWPAETAPGALVERLSTEEAEIVRNVSERPSSLAPARECAMALKRLSCERQRSEVQFEINRLQELGLAEHEREIEVLWVRKKELLQQIEALGT